MSGPFKMKGSEHYGHGNQKRKDGMPYAQYAEAIGGLAKGMMSKKDDDSAGKYASPAKVDEKEKTEPVKTEPVKTEEPHWNYGSTNEEGTKIANKSGDWVSLEHGTEGKAVQEIFNKSERKKTQDRQLAEQAAETEKLVSGEKSLEE